MAEGQESKQKQSLLGTELRTVTSASFHGPEQVPWPRPKSEGTEIHHALWWKELQRHELPKRRVKILGRDALYSILDPAQPEPDGHVRPAPPLPQSCPAHRVTEWQP